MKKLLCGFAVLFVMTLTSATANKTSVEVKAPEVAKKGAEITITINVSHSSNSRIHHTDWVYLKINGKEVERWEYDRDSLPPDADFTIEFKYVVEEELTIEAEGHCNLHGTAGISQVAVKVEDAEEEVAEQLLRR